MIIIIGDVTMAKKKVEMKKDILDKVLNDIYFPVYSQEIIEKNLEDDVDDTIKKLLEPIFGVCVNKKKTGDKNIDNKIPAWHGDTGIGRPDILIYNYFNNNEISLIIEDKNFTSQEDPTPQAIHYADVGNIINKPVRVIIGNSPSKKIDVKVLTLEGYKSLYINSKKI